MSPPKDALPSNLKVVCVITIIAILTYAIWERSVFLIAFVILFYVLTKKWGSQEPTTKRYAIESTRFTAGYVLFLTGLAYLGAAIPATLIAYSAHDYLLQRQSHFEEASIAKSIASKKFATLKPNSLFQLFSDFRSNPLSKFKLLITDIVPLDGEV